MEKTFNHASCTWQISTLQEAAMVNTPLSRRRNRVSDWMLQPSWLLDDRLIPFNI
jgi:hypothetical protein